MMCGDPKPEHYVRLCSGVELSLIHSAGLLLDKQQSKIHMSMAAATIIT